MRFCNTPVAVQPIRGAARLDYAGHRGCPWQQVSLPRHTCHTHICHGASKIQIVTHLYIWLQVLQSHKDDIISSVTLWMTSYVRLATSHWMNGLSIQANSRVLRQAGRLWLWHVTQRPRFMKKLFAGSDFRRFYRYLTPLNSFWLLRSIIFFEYSKIQRIFNKIIRKAASKLVFNMKVVD